MLARYPVMQRSTHAVTVGLLVVISAIAIAVLARGPGDPKPSRVSASLSASGNNASASASTTHPATASARVDSIAPHSQAASALEDIALEASAEEGSELPPGAPREVSMGVVLLIYQGAESAPMNARPKEAARRLAESLIELAQRDFKAAVQRGDEGSSADAGRVPRGVLEPSVELALFSLAKGAVHPTPLDTPRGYWIVRRLD